MATINFRKKISFTRPYSNRKDPQGNILLPAISKAIVGGSLIQRQFVDCNKNSGIPA